MAVRVSSTSLYCSPACARGFTLIEIMTAMLILLIGLGGVVGLLVGSLRIGTEAADRNASATFLAEAVDAVQMEHLLTAETVANYGLTADKLGLYVQTLPQALENDANGPYAQIAVRSSPQAQLGGMLGKPTDLLSGGRTDLNRNEWPRRPNPAFNNGGIPLRVRYRLEKHWDWWPHSLDGSGDQDLTRENLGSAFRGVYILTVTCYRDSDGAMLRPAQVGDPMVVFLRDRKQR